MNDYRCKVCGYFLFATKMQTGSIRVVCRKCRTSQTVRLAPADHHAFGSLTAS